MSSKPSTALADQRSIRVRGKVRAWLMGRRDARRSLVIPTPDGELDSSYLRSIRAGRDGKVVARRLRLAEADINDAAGRIEEGMGPYLLNLPEAKAGSKEARYLCEAIRADVAQALQEAQDSTDALEWACDVERLRYDALSAWYLRGARIAEGRAAGRDEIARSARQMQQALDDARARYEGLLLQHLAD